MAKPEMTYAELVREDAEVSLRRMKHDLAVEHMREGCPVDRGAMACVFHGIDGNEAPLPGWPEPGRH